MLGHVWYVHELSRLEGPGSSRDPPTTLGFSSLRDAAKSPFAKKNLDPSEFEIGILHLANAMEQFEGPGAAENTVVDGLVFGPWYAKYQERYGLPDRPTLKQLIDCAREMPFDRLRMADWNMRCLYHPTAPLGASWEGVVTGQLAAYIRMMNARKAPYPTGIKNAATLEWWFKKSHYTEYLEASACLKGAPLTHWMEDQRQMTRNRAEGFLLMHRFLIGAA